MSCADVVCMWCGSGPFAPDEYRGVYMWTVERYAEACPSCGSADHLAWADEVRGVAR